MPISDAHTATKTRGRKWTQPSSSNTPRLRWCCWLALRGVRSSEPLLALSTGIDGTHKMFGKKEEVDPLRFLIGSAFGWGGLPVEEAYYVSVSPELPVGEYQITAKDVPVDAFWSISVYNKDGYFEENDLGVYSVNNISGEPNEDGSFTVNLGGCGDKRVNCIPLTKGWNYTIRLYEPRAEILDGSWTFPSAQPVKN